MISMPSDSGVTSSSSLSSTSPERIAGLDRGAERDHFVRIQFGVRLGAEQLFDRGAHQRNARGSADHHHFVDLIHRDAGVLDAIAARPERAIDDGRDQLVEQLAIDLALVFLAAIFELDRGQRDEREPFLGLDHGAPQPLHALVVSRQILAPFALRHLRARCAAADCRCRRRPGACRHWWPALRRFRRAASGSKCRKCRRPGRTPRRFRSRACRARRPATPPSVHSPGAELRDRRCVRRPWWPGAGRR